MPKKKFKPVKLKNRRELLDTTKIEQMMAVLCRNPTVFEETVERMTSQDLHSLNVAWAWTWRGCKEWWDAHDGTLPTRAQLVTEIQQLIKDSHGQANAVEIDAIQNFVDLIYDKETWAESLKTSESYAAFAKQTFNRWKQELTIQRLQANLVAGNTVPLDIIDVLRSGLGEVEAAAAADGKKATKVFYEGWRDEAKPKIMSTGHKVLDDFLGGGWLKKEVILFMGPYGSCKTTLAVLLVILAARRCAALTKKSKKGKHYKAVFVTYETTAAQFRDRCIQCAAKIPYHRLKAITSYHDFDDGSNGEPLPYEQKLYKEQIDKGVEYPCELARLVGAEALINDYVVFVDMSHSDPDDPAGTGGVGEVVAALEKERKESPKLVFRLVVVDHLAAMVEAMVAGETIRTEEKRETLKNLPKRFRDSIGVRYDCPVLLIHQLSGQANARGPTAVFHYTDSDECKAVGMFCDFVVCTGPTTQDGRQLCVWQCSKHRREPPRRRQVVKVVGQFNDLVGYGHKYVVDTNTGRIVTVDHYADMHGEKPEDLEGSGEPGDYDTGEEEEAAAPSQQPDPQGPDDDAGDDMPVTKLSAKNKKGKPKPKPSLGEV